MRERNDEGRMTKADQNPQLPGSGWTIGTEELRLQFIAADVRPRSQIGVGEKERSSALGSERGNRPPATNRNRICSVPAAGSGRGRGRNSGDRARTVGPSFIRRASNVLRPSSFVSLPLLLLSLLATSPTSPATPPTLPPHTASLETAAQALAEDIPQVAIQKLEAVLNGQPSMDVRAAASRMLARACLAVGRPEDALRHISPAHEPEEMLLKAGALGALGRWTEALEAFRELAEQQRASRRRSSSGRGEESVENGSDDNDDTAAAAATATAATATSSSSREGGETRSFADAALIGEADALRALGRTPEAVRLLQGFVERKPDHTLARLQLASFLTEIHQIKRVPKLLAGTRAATALEEKWKRYVEGRMLLLQDQAVPALIEFEEILRDRRGLTEGLFVGATVGATEALIILHGRAVADNVIEDFLWRQPQSAYLEEMFARLDRIYTDEENASEAELAKLAAEPPSRRGALALYYLGKMQIREKRHGKGLRTLGKFTRSHPEHPLAGDAWMLMGDTLLRDGRTAAAVSAYEMAMRRAGGDPAAFARAELAAGAAHFRQGEYLLAATRFRSAGERAPKLLQTALYNSALAWLNLGNYDRFLEDYKALSERFPESEWRRELLLEEGLLQARSRDFRRAEETLKLFLRDFAGHARVPEARIALAEIALFSSEVATAADYLKAAHEWPPVAAGPVDARADYLAIFVADAAPQRADAAVIELCKKFLAEHPDSALESEVRMKLGQVYFRQEDYANAQTQFETLAAGAPGSALAETALFLAGQSAMRSMNPSAADRALELFERVAKGNGPLKLHARQQQAIVKSQLGRHAEAIILFDSILGANPADELRFAALCGKADSLVATAPNDPQAYEKAIAIYDQLATDPEVARPWRNQALYKKAKCLERQGAREGALAVFYEVLQPRAIAVASAAPGATPAAGDEDEVEKEATGDVPEYFWYYKAGFDAARLLEAQEKWKSAIGMYEKMAKAAGPRSEEAGKRAEQLRLEHFVWE